MKCRKVHLYFARLQDTLRHFLACVLSVMNSPQSVINQGTFDHDRGQKSAISGRRLHCTGGSPLDFLLFLQYYVQFSKTSPLKSGESSEKSTGENRVKSCHVCGCHGFFGVSFKYVLSFKCAALSY